jgi:hypothetical protein
MHPLIFSYTLLHSCIPVLENLHCNVKKVFCFSWRFIYINASRFLDSLWILDHVFVTIIFFSFSFFIPFLAPTGAWGIHAQAVSCWLPTAAARVQTRGLVMWDFVMDKSGAGAGFLRVLRFPPSIFIPPISPKLPSPIIRGWYNRPVVAAVPEVPPHKL